MIGRESPGESRETRDIPVVLCGNFRKSSVPGIGGRGVYGGDGGEGGGRPLAGRSGGKEVMPHPAACT